MEVFVETPRSLYKAFIWTLEPSPWRIICRGYKKGTTNQHRAKMGLKRNENRGKDQGLRSG